MGANAWRDEDEWPLARTRGASGSTCAATAGPTARAATAASRAQRAGRRAARPLRLRPARPRADGRRRHAAALAADRRPLGPARPARRSRRAADVLVYTTEPLQQDTRGHRHGARCTSWPRAPRPTRTGRPSSSTCTPTGGRSASTDGIVRARYREGLDRPQLLEPDEPTRVRRSCVGLDQHAVPRRAPHPAARCRARTSRASRGTRTRTATSPRSTEADLRPARQTVFHDAAHASCLQLPVVPPPG